jgi:hypothetical protein
MFHDRAAFGGSLLAVGVLYMWLTEFPLRNRERWAWWTLLSTGSIGFLSFLAYMGYGYLDSWHGAGTLALLPLFAVGMVRTRLLLADGAHQRPNAADSRAGSRIGRLLLLATALGMMLGGATILVIGMTVVFVKHDLAFMNVTRAFLDQLNSRLIPLIAHDRAGFGGGLLCTGLVVAACVWFSPMTRALRQALLAAGLFGFGCAIGVHFAVGYTTFLHLAPAFAGAGMFALGMMLSVEPRRARSDQPASRPAAELARETQTPANS